MLLQNQFTQILDYLDNIPGQVNVFFEAHYWGRFRLLTNSSTVFPDPEGFIPLAQIQSPPYDTWLLLDTEAERIILRENDAAEHKVIAFNLEEFFGPTAALKQTFSSGDGPFAFDQRQKIAALLPPSDYLITAINDPEFFEDLEGYYELLSLLAQLTQGDLLFTSIAGKEEGVRKTFDLQKGAQQWQISTTRELFDNAFIQQLNQILRDLSISNYTLATSLHEEMRMIILRLPSKKFPLLDRMGLLV